MAVRRLIKPDALYLGIDPGKQGYLCVVDTSTRIAAMWKIPYLGDEPDLHRLRRSLLIMHERGVQYALLEEQHAFHKEGPVGAFTNGFGYGALKTSLVWSGIPFEIRKPEDWKREMNIPVPSVPPPKLPPKPSTKKGRAAWDKKVKAIKARVGREKKRQRKDLANRRAQQLAPGYDFRTSTAWNAKINDGKCESFLLAVLACRTTRGGTE